MERSIFNSFLYVYQRVIETTWPLSDNRLPTATPIPSLVLAPWPPCRHRHSPPRICFHHPLSGITVARPSSPISITGLPPENDMSWYMCDNFWIHHWRASNLATRFWEDSGSSGSNGSSWLVFEGDHASKNFRIARKINLETDQLFGCQI